MANLSSLHRSAGGPAPLLLVLLFISGPPAAAEYDPAVLPDGVLPAPVDLMVRDPNRNRHIPIRVHLPASTRKAAVTLFSHGLGGSRRGGSYLAKHWSARGYVVVAMQHPGSDESVWKDVAFGDRLSTLKTAASLRNSITRMRDVPAVLDQLQTWNQTSGHVLFERLDVSRVGMSGHSFGAVTTQGVSGQTPPLIGKRFLEPRIKAAVMLSPSSPARADPQQSFGEVSIPWFLITGTKDVSPVRDLGVPNRRKVYAAVPETIDKYELVLHEAEHFAFADERDRWRDEQRNPNHHRAILALTTAFWDSYLNGNAEARRWLQSRRVETVLEPLDQWQANRGED
jgi:predicted dienelactone hydrolase